MTEVYNNNSDVIILKKLQCLPWLFLCFLTLICCVGFLELYSASKGSFDPWASRQMIRFFAAIPLMLIVAVIDIRIWYQFANWFYLVGLGLLVLTAVVGVEGGLGAQRWLNIAGFQFQPSEIAKICLVLALARYYHRLHPNNIQKITSLFFPAMLVGLSSLLVLKQPNLGTAAIMVMMSAVLVFMGGVSWKKFALAGIIAVAMLPVVWMQMHDYQKRRVETFLNPESDPLGAGYNIIQSKIAIGSGGIWGKGFLKGTQSQLNFVPEKQTDFIFAIVAEEWGMVGGLVVIALYAGLIFSGILIATRAYSTFGRLLAYGVVTLLFLHVFINIGMVMGLLPVVGVPLPLISYGGTNMISTLIGLGFVLNVQVHRKTEIT